MRDGNGHELALQLSAARFHYLGEPAILVASLDTTGRRRLEDERRARAEAEAASRAKSAFVAHMGHEFRTPLNAVLGFAQLLGAEGDAPLAPRQRRQVEAIREAALHLLALTTDVLDVSRIESGHVRIEMRDVALKPLVEEALQLVEPLAQRWGVRLAPTPPVDAWVRGDPLRLRQVLLNLLSNAIKYNRTGGSAGVEVDVQAVSVELRVGDTGIGMTPEQLARLFRPYERLGRERGEVEGTGLGMSVTRQLVEAMRGRLEVESEAGVGTTVRWTLPPGEAQEVPPAAATAVVVAADEPVGTVLYIEDNPVNVLLVEELLRRWPGVRFESVEDGTQGLELARRLQPDLVLLDAQLPDMDGYAVLAALRAEPRTQALRVVMLSADAQLDSAERARAAGALDYWTKPLDMDRFVGAMRHVLAAATT